MFGHFRTKLAFSHAIATTFACWALASAGCATSQSTVDKPRPGQGIVEYEELIAESQHGINQALAALDRISEAAPCCAHRDIDNLSQVVEHLQVDSLRIRARAQAIQERGDAWFRNWHQHVTQISDPRIRALADQNRPELQQRFTALKANAIQTRASFKPFFDGLREIRNTLEKDPAAIQFGPMQERLRATRAQGEELKARLAATGLELEEMRGLVTPGKTTVSR